MSLFNLDDLVIIGPGSEWFWTMVSGIVVAVTLVGLYQQVRMQRAAAALDQLGATSREWDDEMLARVRLEVLLAVQAGADGRALPDNATSTILDFWERLGYLTKAGHLDRSLVYETFAMPCLAWWARLEPKVQDSRATTGQRKLSEDFEWLAGFMAARQRAEGAVVVFDEAFLASRLEGSIRAHRDDIRLREELRAVIVRPMSTGYVSPDPAAPRA